MDDLRTVEVISLFVRDVATAKAFYLDVFGASVLMEDAVSSLVQFNNLLFNLLQSDQATELVEPTPIAAATGGSTFMFTVKVADIASTVGLLFRLERGL